VIPAQAATSWDLVGPLGQPEEGAATALFFASGASFIRR